MFRVAVIVVRVTVRVVRVVLVGGVKVRVRAALVEAVSDFFTVVPAIDRPVLTGLFESQKCSF